MWQGQWCIGCSSWVVILVQSICTQNPQNLKKNLLNPKKTFAYKLSQKLRFSALL